MRLTKIKIIDLFITNRFCVRAVNVFRIFLIERIGVSLKSSTSGSYFLLKIIVGFVGAVALLLIVVGIMVLLYKITNQKVSQMVRYHLPLVYGL